jgi:hypothetical protein
LRDEQRAEPQRIDGVLAPKRQLAPAQIDQVRADKRMVHRCGAATNDGKEIIEFAIAHRLHVAAGVVELADDRLAAKENRLAAAQRISTIHVKPRLSLAQAPQTSRYAAVVVQIGGVIDPNHGGEACS